MTYRADRFTPPTEVELARLARKRERMAKRRAADPEAARRAYLRAYDRLRERSGLPPVDRSRPRQERNYSVAMQVFRALVKQGRKCALCGIAFTPNPTSRDDDFHFDAGRIALAHDTCLRKAAREARAAEPKPDDGLPSAEVVLARATAAVANGEACGSCGVKFGYADDPTSLRALYSTRYPGHRHNACPRVEPEGLLPEHRL